jgi:predicted CoA-binding protein
MTHVNDPELVRKLLTTPATWAVVGLSANRARVAYGVAGFLKDGLGKRIIPVNLRSEAAHGETGYARLADVPGTVDVVDFFVNSSRVGAVVDEAIAERERLGITAIWLQLGVVDDDAAARAQAAGLDVVMDTCPAIEAPRLGL